MRAVGSSIPRVDAVEKVAGTATFPADLDLPGQAWLKIVFAGVPHAQIRKMDIESALRAPGVIAVLTAADVPANEYGLVIPDQPVLCGLGSSKQAEFVRWEADHVALVVAETARQAEAAAALIAIDYGLLPVVTDPLQALQEDAPILHPFAFSSFPYGERDTKSNLLRSYRIRRGDVHSAMHEADVVVESFYQTQPQEHAYLQPEAGLAHVLPDGRIEVICAGQWMHEERQQIAHALQVEEAQVVIRYPAIGGAFGGREDISVQIALALAAIKTGRPVKTVWNREDSIVGHHKRHAYQIKAKWGVRADGRIVAAEMDVTSDAGAYAYTSTKVLGNALMACLGPYEIENVLVEARTVYTNNCPGGAFRGFGGPQGHFAAEMQMNKLAHALEMDPVEIRMRNLWREGSVLPTRSVVPKGCTVRNVLEKAADKAGWSMDLSGAWTQASADTDIHMATTSVVSSNEQAMSVPSTLPLENATSLGAGGTRISVGRGVATCFKNVGFSLGFPESCAAWVELRGATQIERAIVGCVGAEVGQGAHSLFRQVAAEVLGLDVAQVELQATHSDIAGSSGSASASRMSFMAGNAIQGAATRALQAWREEERPARAEYVYYPRATTAYDEETGASDPNITYGYCAQVAQVAVDLDTGHVTVLRLISANDVGRAVNPQQVEGQIEGAVAQSLGWTLLEEFQQKDGKAITTHLSNYLIPGVLDVVQEIEPLILEFPDPQGPLGIRGMAEMPFIPTAPAIAAAIHAAIGVWIDTLPLTPERIWHALSQAAQATPTG